jgi:hypothetical protein
LKLLAERNEIVSRRLKEEHQKITGAAVKFGVPLRQANKKFTITDLKPAQNCTNTGVLPSPSLKGC